MGFKSTLRQMRAQIEQGIPEELKDDPYVLRSYLKVSPYSPELGHHKSDRKIGHKANKHY